MACILGERAEWIGPSDPALRPGKEVGVLDQLVGPQLAEIAGKLLDESTSRGGSLGIAAEPDLAPPAQPRSPVTVRVPQQPTTDEEVEEVLLRTVGAACADLLVAHDGPHQFSARGARAGTPQRDLDGGGPRAFLRH